MRKKEHDAQHLRDAFDFHSFQNNVLLYIGLFFNIKEYYRIYEKAIDQRYG
jgi:hypothetical protein